MTEDNRIEFVPLRVSFLLSVKENQLLQDWCQVNKCKARRAVEQALREMLLLKEEEETAR